MMKRSLAAIVAFFATVSVAFGMGAASVPPKFPIPWGNSAGSSFIRTIPQASQIGIQNCAASLTDGFPPLSFTPVSAGGCAPFGQDFNGIFKQITQWAQWQAAGAPVVYDSNFSASIGGYPKGTILADAAIDGGFWFNTTDNNTSDPDTSGAGWVAFSPTGQGAQATVDITTSGAFTISAANQVIGLNRTVSPAASSATLPTGVQNGKTIEIQDLAQNFDLYPVTISAPPGQSIAGAPNVLLNVNGQDAKFTYHSSTSTWACNCLNVSDPVGSLKIMAYTTPDSGYLVADGACVSQTTYATLFGVIGSTYSTQNSCTSGQFGLPDLRGRLPAGADNMGGTAANRLTVFSATGVGKTGGVQNSVVQQSNLASFTMSGTSNVSGNITVSGTLNGSVTTSGATGGGGGSMITGQSQIGTTPISTSGSLSGSNTMSGTSSVNSGGSSSAMTTFPNAQTAYYEIKF